MGTLAALLLLFFWIKRFLSDRPSRTARLWRAIWRRSASVREAPPAP
jgi:hypothetical protein